MQPSNSQPASNRLAKFHLPGLFEFYELYRAFLPLYREHRDWFYDWCEIASIYGTPADCVWGGGRVGFGDDIAEDVIELLNEHQISPRLTFSNSLLTEQHLSDKKCNSLCCAFHEKSKIKTGIVIYSDLLLDYLKKKYSDFYFVSSTTKVLTEFEDFRKEVERDDFEYVVPDFRLNKMFEKLEMLSEKEKDKVEFLCNECCFIGCKDRKACYENVSRKSLGEEISRGSESDDSSVDENGDFICHAPGGDEGYSFSRAIKNPAFISIDDIQNKYLKMGFSNFKIEGRGLGSAVVLEFLLYYLTKPEHQIEVRENIYLDSMLDLF